MFDKDRFGGVVRLYGEAIVRGLETQEFVVVGVGGVGSWAAEALCRTGVQHLTLIDADSVALSNTNRQLQATESAVGLSKVEALKRRFLEINPAIDIKTREVFVSEENVDELIPSGVILLDCIDQMSAKAILLAKAKDKGCFVVTSGGAGGRVDPTRVKSDDLARVKGDPLLSTLRHTLRKSFGFPAADKRLQPFGIAAVYTDEPMQRALAENESKLNCAKQTTSYGTSITVTATMGLTMTAIAINQMKKEF